MNKKRALELIKKYYPDCIYDNIRLYDIQIKRYRSSVFIDGYGFDGTFHLMPFCGKYKLYREYHNDSYECVSDCVNISKGEYKKIMS